MLKTVLSSGCSEVPLFIYTIAAPEQQLWLISSALPLFILCYPVLLSQLISIANPIVFLVVVCCIWSSLYSQVLLAQFHISHNVTVQSSSYRLRIPEKFSHNKLFWRSYWAFCSPAYCKSQ